ncbi:hypothetical protein HHX47_DHR1001961 [Lentinula edodes]|nr:hypothetical protein HHX47_DHR1001961 [Lentinula edodes]
MVLERLAPNHVDNAPREVSLERKGRSLSPPAAFSRRFSLSPSQSRKRKPHTNHTNPSSLSPKGHDLSRGRSLTLITPERPKRRSHSSFGRLTQNRWPSSLGSCAWDVSEHVLEALTSTAQFAPVPYLGTLCTVALAIFNAVRTAKDNQDVLNQLAFAACDLVYTVHKTYQDLYPLHPSSLSQQNLKTQFSSDPLLKEHIDELMRTSSQSTLVDESQDPDPERMLNGDDSESILVFGRKRKPIDSTSMTKSDLKSGQGTPGFVSDTSCELVADPESLNSFALEKTKEAAAKMEAGVRAGLSVLTKVM